MARKRLDPDEMVPGQLDIFGNVLTQHDINAAMKARRGRTKEAGITPRYVEHKRRDLCHTCIRQQREASVRGLPVPQRKRARWRREILGAPAVYLCRRHAQDMRTWDSLPPLPPERKPTK